MIRVKRFERSPRRRLPMSHETITTEEMLRDIADTEHEIAVMEQEIKGYRLLSDRLSHFKADARVDGIQKRRDFIAKVQAILNERRTADSQTKGESDAD